MRKTGSIVLFLSALCMAVSAQTEEFRFKLYLESLSSGKKDTLELGVGPNGMVGCDYDSTLCTVYTEPFFDTAEHIGAFLVPGIREPHPAYRDDKFRVSCPIYAKRRIVLWERDLVVVFPAKEHPVRVNWDMQQLQNPIVETPILTNIDEGGRFDAVHRPAILLFMSETDSCLIDYSNYGQWCDSAGLYTYITDSTGVEHPYIHFYVLLGEDRDLGFGDWGDWWNWIGTEDVKRCILVSVSPNPIRDRFKINSDIELNEWQVYSVSGKLILSGRGADTEINCRDWAAGIYVFRWTTGNNETGFLKIIKE